MRAGFELNKASRNERLQHQPRVKRNEVQFKSRRNPEGGWTLWIYTSLRSVCGYSCSRLLRGASSKSIISTRAVLPIFEISSSYLEAKG